MIRTGIWKNATVEMVKAFGSRTTYIITECDRYLVYQCQRGYGKRYEWKAAQITGKASSPNTLVRWIERTIIGAARTEKAAQEICQQHSEGGKNVI